MKPIHVLTACGLICALAFTARLAHANDTVEAPAVESAEAVPVVESAEAPTAESAEAAPAHPKGIVPIPPYQGSLKKRLRLTGDWGGARTELAESGLQVYVDWYQEYFGGVSGGVNPPGLASERQQILLKSITGSLEPEDFRDLRQARRAEKTDPDMGYFGALDYIVVLDTGAMDLWPGGILMLHGETIYGDYSNIDTGVLLPLSLRTSIPAIEYPLTTLSHVTYTQHFSHKLSLEIGKIIGGDVSVSERPLATGNGSSTFMNMALQFNPVFTSTMPYSTLGIDLEIKPTEILTMNFSVVDSEGDAQVSGFDTVFDGGTSFAARGQLKTHFFGKPGEHALGAAYSNDTYVDLGRAVDIKWQGRNFGQSGGRGPSVEGLNTVEGSWAVGWAGMQYLSYEEETKRGIALFGRFGLADEETNPFETYAAAGIWGRGTFKSRPADEWGLAFFHTEMSDSIPDFLGLSNEYGAELFYKFMVTPWFDITPDVQVVNPGTENADTVVTLGLRANVRF